MAIGIPGINLPTQSMAGPVATGQAYAQQIAGGMPMEQVIAPGVSYSPEMAGGYTQKDLDMISAGPAPVMPSAPTKGTPLEAPYETMPYAPVGTPMPTPFIPGKTSFTGIPDFLKDLNFSSLPDVDYTTDFADFSKDTSSPGPDLFNIRSDVEPKEDFFKVDQNLFNFEEIADKIDMDEVAKIDIEKINIPESVSVFSNVLNQPVETQPVLPSIFDQPTAPVMPTMPMEPMVQPITAPVIPAQTLPQSIVANIPKPQPLPMPVIPRFIQPNIDEIVKPISRQGKFLPQAPRGLFSL
jgi:hypothetical protein